MPGYRYLLDDFLADANTGHKVVATVFEECRAMYRARGPQEMKPVGEVEFCVGVAAMSDSGRYGDTRVAAGIVGHADLPWAIAWRRYWRRRSRPAAGASRASASARLGRRSGDRQQPRRQGAGVHRSAAFRAGLKRLFGLGLSFDAWVFHHQIAEADELARAFPDGNIVLCHMGGVLGYGRWAGKRDEVFTAWKAAMTELAKCPNVSVNVGGLMMRLAALDYLPLPAPPTSQQLADAWRPYAGRASSCSAPTAHGREQLPGR